MRLLCLAHPGTNSRGLLLDIAAGFREAGCDLLQFELAPFWKRFQSEPAGELAIKQLLAETLLPFIESNRIDASFALWANGPLSLPVLSDGRSRAESMLSAARHMHLHFWWDAPHWHAGGAMHQLFGTGMFSGPHSRHVVNNRHTAGEMVGILGFSNVLPSANAANPALFRPQPDVAPEYDLVFLSGGGDPEPTPIMLEELGRDEPNIERIRQSVAESLAPRLESLAAELPAELRRSGRRLLEALVAERLADRHAPALVHLQRAAHRDAALGVAADALVCNPSVYVRATEAIRWIETWERPFTVAYLSRRFRCLRIGAQDYAAWGIEGDEVAPQPYDQQSRAYARARVALNVMRWQDDCSLNSKIFEITASRVPCLQAWRGGLDELFDPLNEVVAFRSPVEAADRLSELLRSSERREAVAEAGFRRTLSEHTWAHRAAALLPALRSQPTAPTIATAPQTTREPQAAAVS